MNKRMIDDFVNSDLIGPEFIEYMTEWYNKYRPKYYSTITPDFVEKMLYEINHLQQDYKSYMLQINKTVL